ncbi:MAG: hypothetical protein KAS17_02110 [Victivallaceae bacterium]|nr:hypothetical protein [Victivallaceae bacterium]
MHRFPEFGIDPKSDGTIDYDKLGQRLASPGIKIDTEIFDALALLDEMSADRNFNLLHDAVGDYALVCDDIPGLEKIIPVQCKFQTAKGEIVAIHGDLAVQVVRGLKLSILVDGRIVSAKFKVKFTDSRTERMVTVKTGNLAEFKYDDDDRLIEQWLTKRGFKHEQRQ